MNIPEIRFPEFKDDWEHKELNKLLSEQKTKNADLKYSIANFFSVLDNKINQLKEKKALLEEYKKGMMQKIFSQEIRFKDNKGNEFVEWQKIKLSELTERITNLNF